VKYAFSTEHPLLDDNGDCRWLRPVVFSIRYPPRFRLGQQANIAGDFGAAIHLKPSIWSGSLHRKAAPARIGNASSTLARRRKSEWPEAIITLNWNSCWFIVSSVGKSIERPDFRRSLKTAEVAFGIPPPSFNHRFPLPHFGAIPCAVLQCYAVRLHARGFSRIPGRG